MNADDRLSLDPLGPVEGGNRIVEGSRVADVCPQPTNPKPLDELTQLGAIGYDDEVDSQAARGPRLGRAGDGHQRSSGANHARRPLPDVAADDIENQIDFADVFQGVVIEVDELLCAEVESRLTAASAPGAEDVLNFRVSVDDYERALKDLVHCLEGRVLISHDLAHKAAGVLLREEPFRY